MITTTSKPCSGHSDRGPSLSDRRSGRHDWNSGQGPNQKSAQQKDESLAAKLMACKEQEKCYKKVVKNPMLYLEEHYHQINPAEHQLEVHSMRFFGAGAESTAIEVLAIIDWAAEFLELSHSPIPEIPAFLRRPFVVSKKVQFPIPEDPGDAILKEKCVRTKAQKAWVYLCMLLQFWTDKVTTESGEIMYGRRHRAHQSYDCVDKGCAQPQFQGTFPDYVGFHCHINILDPSSSLFRTSGERVLPVGTRPHTGHAEPTRDCH